MIDRTQPPSSVEREVARIVRELLDGDTERGVMLLAGDRRVLYANGAARTLFSDGSPRGHDACLPLELEQLAGRLVDAARAEQAPQAQEVAWPNAEARCARVLLEVTRRSADWYVVVRTLRAKVGSEPTIRRLQACWQLTLREAQVMAGVARGQSNGEVATTLGIVEKTVKNVLMAVYQKVGVRNRVELALRAYDVGPVLK